MAQLKRIMLSTLLVLGLLAAPVLAAEGVFAQQTGDPIEEGLQRGTCLNVTGPGGDCPGEDVAENRVNSIITTVINIFSLIVGVVAVVMIIIGGLKYITSGGDSGNITSAKNTLLYAIIGLVIVALAQIIVRFVLAQATNTTP